MPKPQREPAYIKLTITEDAHALLADFKKQWAGTPVAEVEIRVETGNGRSQEVNMTLSEFLEAVGLEDADKEIRPCETCRGSGEVRAMGAVYPGEPHQADIETEKCPDCSLDKGHEPDEE